MPLTSNDLAGIAAMLLVMSIPIIAILTSHQRKMAELMRRDNSLDRPSNKNEIEELKQLVYSQSISIENLSNKIDALRLDSRTILPDTEEVNARS